MNSKDKTCNVFIGELPRQRLQLRWVATDNPRYWICKYELVFPLSETDIRRGIPHEGKMSDGEFVVNMGDETDCKTSSNAPPTFLLDGTRYYDPPWRYGRHAEWDSEVLNLPVFVIAHDNVVFQLPK